jgi:hypothetical protein
MRIVSERPLAIVLGGLAGTPRVVGGGNFGTPWQAMPVREGVTLESPFAGPGRRGQSRLRYFPCRLSLVPRVPPGLAAGW